MTDSWLNPPPPDYPRPDRLEELAAALREALEQLRVVVAATTEAHAQLQATQAVVYALFATHPAPETVLEMQMDLMDQPQPAESLAAAARFHQQLLQALNKRRGRTDPPRAAA